MNEDTLRKGLFPLIAIGAIFMLVGVVAITLETVNNNCCPVECIDCPEKCDEKCKEKCDKKCDKTGRDNCTCKYCECPEVTDRCTCENCKCEES